MTMLYDFFNNPQDGKLYMEIWEEKADGIEYLWSVPVDSIAHGYSVLEKYREGGHTVKRG